MYQKEGHIKEQELVTRLIEGDEEAFCSLYGLYKERLIFFALKFLKSNEYAEDIVQDTFTHIWMGRHFINPDIPFSAFLYTIVKNRVLNQLRNLEKKQLLKNHLLKYSFDYTEDTNENILSHDLKDLIQQAFETLTPRQQEIFRLSREGQLSYKEIAEKLHISVNTVHEHIALSLNTIRRYLIKYAEMQPKALLLFCLFYI